MDAVEVQNEHISLDYELHYRDGDRFFFVENVDPESELGEYKMHEYRYTGSE